ncbi:WD40 repeat domain-containing protein [Streptomyces sp. NBC_00237]|uniref:WD40 repeat domain-containing protein n=1 Tax=Streptomyces sp. NBC_00237 TaxID=2975687 RepID=UPI0022563541|nr:WD40 repeat domain-containing protein [Streptomyces sp. NBC_00237]MCX5200492.1 WD40 repeat domain-containing protein [Streptomyces sp. NBC_00237]
MRSSRTCVVAVAALGLALVSPAVAVADDGGFTIKDPRITESSGLAASRAHPGVYWTHNDQDGPYVYAVDSRTGETVARITMKGVGKPRDMEAISVGPDGDVYVGDIGDNLGGSWDHVWIYRFPEPKELKDQTVRATQYDVKYADGARNAEAMMVHPKTGRVYIGSKEEDGAGLYEGPSKLDSGRTNVFRKVHGIPWVTDGAFSPDGKRLVLRSYLGAESFAWPQMGEGKGLGIGYRGQAESVTFTPDGRTMLFGAEGEQSEVFALAVEEGEGATPGGGTSESPSGSGSGSGSGGSGGSGSPEDTGLSGKGVLVLGLAGVAVLAWLGFRRKR